MKISVAAYLSKVIARLRKEIAVRTDERMRLMNEIVSGIQVIKMYAWEKPFAKLVEVARWYVSCNGDSRPTAMGIHNSLKNY
jgi:ATP-binding cassette subfamily C (CFTR/MRP) protein 4